MNYRVIAERPGPLLYDGHPVRNPFRILNIFDPYLKTRTERRTWDSVEADDEAGVRKLFAEAAEMPELGLRGFRIVSIEPIRVEPAW